MSDRPAQLHISFEIINGSKMTQLNVEDFPELKELLLTFAAMAYPSCTKIMHNHDETVEDENITSAFTSDRIDVVFWNHHADTLKEWMPDHPFHTFFQNIIAKGTLPPNSLFEIKTHWKSTSSHTTLWAEKRKTEHEKNTFAKNALV